MSEIIIRREHTLGLERARRVAKIWANGAAKKLEMNCTTTSSDSSDRVEFSRLGVKGYMEATASYIEVHVTLGMLFAPFAKQLESEVSQRLDGSIAWELERPT